MISTLSNFRFQTETDATNMSPSGSSFECLDCETLFPSVSDLDQHILGSHHNNPAAKEKDDDRKLPFWCADCGKGFPSRFGLNVHIKAVHLGLTLVCEICGTETVYGELNRHLKKEHGMEPMRRSGDEDC